MDHSPLILSLETATLGGSVWLGRGNTELAARKGDPLSRNRIACCETLMIAWRSDTFVGGRGFFCVRFGAREFHWIANRNRNFESPRCHAQLVLASEFRRCMPWPILPASLRRRSHFCRQDAERFSRRCFRFQMFPEKRLLARLTRRRTFHPRNYSTATVR